MIYLPRKKSFPGLLLLSSPSPSSLPTFVKSPLLLYFASVRKEGKSNVRRMPIKGGGRREGSGLVWNPEFKRGAEDRNGGNRKRSDLTLLPRPSPHPFPQGCGGRADRGRLLCELGKHLPSPPPTCLTFPFFPFLLPPFLSIPPFLQL